MELSQCSYDCLVIRKIWNRLQKSTPYYDVIKNYGHSTPSERMSHIEGITKNQYPRALNWTGWQKTVRHAADTAIFNTVLEWNLNVSWRRIQSSIGMRNLHCHMLIIYQANDTFIFHRVLSLSYIYIYTSWKVDTHTHTEVSPGSWGKTFSSKCAFRSLGIEPRTSTSTRVCSEEIW